MPSMRGAGPACCCCRHFLRLPDNIQNNTTPSYAHAVSATEDFDLEMVHGGSSGRIISCANVDWVGKRMYYAEYDGAPDTYLRWWEVGKFAGPDFDPPVITGDVATLNDYYVFSLATSADESKIYYAGLAEPYPDLSVDFAIELCEINYDGTGQATLDSIDVYRTGPGLLGMVGPMMVNRTAQYLYYVVRQNYSTATAADWEISIRRRDLATFTESTIYSAVFPTGAAVGPSYIRQINCLSFDIDNEKIYWVDHYFNASGRTEGFARRANYDGSGIETLYQSADPYRINSVNYSNSLKKIVHHDYNRNSTAPAPLDGIWIRNADWSEVSKISLTRRASGDMALPPNSVSTALWCGLEKTGAGSKA